MAKLYERYNTGHSSGIPVYSSAIHLAQTFTVGNTGSAEDNITSVNLLIYTYIGHSPGTVLVSIRDVDGAGKPTGGDLAIGSTDGNTLDPNIILWREINLSPRTELSAGSKYAVVVRCPTADNSNRISWRSDHINSLYGGGELLLSNDSGSTWGRRGLGPGTMDYMFEEYGVEIGAAYMAMKKIW